MGKRKHRPQRTCVGCRQVEDKSGLIRIVRSPQGVFVDPSGKRSGRGAYVHPRQECWQQGLEASLERALRTDLDREEKERLREELASRVEGSKQE